MLIETRRRPADEAVRAQAPARPSRFGGVRTRVLVSFLVLLVISTAASVLVLREVLLSRIGDQLETTLAEQVESLRTLSEAGEEGDGEPFANVASLFDTYLDRTAPPVDGALIAFAGGEPARAAAAAGVDRSLVEATGGLAGLTEPTSGELSTADGPARFVAVPVRIGQSRGVLVAAALTAAEREQVESAVRIAIGVSVVVMLLASLFIWLAAGRAVAPLKALSQTARRITEADLSERIPVRGGDEIAELGRTFNGMLDRLEVAFAGQKEFLADVSHELRTPITVIRGHIETLGDSPEERREAIAVIQGELDRMNRFVDDLLVLTKAARPDFLRPAPIDLELFTHDLFAKAQRLGERDWRLERTGVGVVVADPHQLTQAIMNLAENAARHTSAGERIWLGSAVDGTAARLWVRDEGPGIEPVERERIFERFARGGGASGADGAGLGLAIVKAVAEAHGGWVELESAPGRGAAFEVVIPLSPGRRP